MKFGFSRVRVCRIYRGGCWKIDWVVDKVQFELWGGRFKVGLISGDGEGIGRGVGVTGGVGVVNNTDVGGGVIGGDVGEAVGVGEGDAVGVDVGVAVGGSAVGDGASVGV